MYKGKQLFILISFVGIFGYLLFLSTNSVSAGAKLVNSKTSTSTSGSGEPFGGRVTYKTPCTCAEGYQVTVSGPNGSSGTYLETSAANAHKAYNISMGRFVLGKYTKGGSCMVTSGPSCVDIGISKGTITMFGVSFGSASYFSLPV
jgi:hypothetical protein